MKVFARADKELNRRFAGALSQFETVMGSFLSAFKKGSNPIAGYCSAIEKVLDLAVKTAGRGRTYSVMAIVNAMFAPRGLGGWDIPHIVG